MIAKIDLTKLGRNCAVAITPDGTTNILTYVEDSSNIEIGYNQNNNTVTVTIAGTTSATTKNITTGTFLTMDSGSGPVTITSYATFKTNYALLFLNGGSAPTPTLNEVLNAGYIAIDKIIELSRTTDNYNLQLSNLLEIDNNLGSGTGQEFYRTFYEYDSLSFQKRNWTNTLIYDCKLAPNQANTGTSIINYLPENSGTLLNGEFISGGIGLKLEYGTGYFTLGDGNTNKANFKIESLIDRAIINCEDLQFNGTNLKSGSSGGNSGEHLVITLNGTQYKIKLENP